MILNNAFEMEFLQAKNRAQNISAFNTALPNETLGV